MLHNAGTVSFHVPTSSSFTVGATLRPYIISVTETVVKKRKINK